MRIAKNDSVHAIWLKLSKTLRFISLSLVSLSRVRLGRCCQETLRSVRICKFADIANSYARYG